RVARAARPRARPARAAAAGVAPPTAATARTAATSSRQPMCPAMRIFMSDVSRPAACEDDVLQALPLHAIGHRRQRREPPVARIVERREFAAVVDHEQHAAVPPAVALPPWQE